MLWAVNAITFCSAKLVMFIQGLSHFSSFYASDLTYYLSVVFLPWGGKVLFGISLWLSGRCVGCVDRNCDSLFRLRIWMVERIFWRANISYGAGVTTSHWYGFLCIVEGRRFQPALSYFDHNFAAKVNWDELEEFQIEILTTSTLPTSSIWTCLRLSLQGSLIVGRQCPHDVFRWSEM